jgi:hypothetical protein
VTVNESDSQSRVLSTKSTTLLVAKQVEAPLKNDVNFSVFSESFVILFTLFFFS